MNYHDMIQGVFLKASLTLELCYPYPGWGGGLLHQLFGNLALALSILIFVIQKTYDNFS